MKKRLTALMLALLMVVAVVFTGCNTSTEITEEETRNALTITITCVTGDETTPEAIKKVQDAINLITRQRFSTQIILRFYKESEYNEKIDNLVADIALEEQQKADNEEASASAAKESKRIADIDKLIAQDKAEVTTRKLIIWEQETEEQTTAETFETEQNILGENVQKYPQASDTQLDIFLICGTENLNKYVTDETYATDGESFLVSMNESLTLAAKAITQYVNSTVLLAGKVNNTQYAIPTNKQVADKSTYLILDKELLKKYNYTVDDMRTITNTNFINYMQALVENEPDVVPLLAEPEAPGIVGLFDDETIFGTYVANTAVAGFKAVPKNLFSAYQYTDHYTFMKQYRRNGYIRDDVPEGTRWGASVVTTDADGIAEYDEEKYEVKIIGKGIATTDTVGQYMFGISKYTKDPTRCMEIITYLTTNPEFRNLLQYGVEGYNYKINPDTSKLERLTHDYMMNIFATGNTFIAYPEEDMELDVWEKAKEANKTAIVSPYMGFIFENEKNAELIEKMKQLSATMLDKLNAYDVEADRVKQLAELQEKLDEYNKTAAEWEVQLAAPAVAVKPYQEAVDAATEALKPYNDALAAVKNELKPYTAQITTIQNKIKTLEAQIKTEQAIAPTEDAPEAAPDQAKIDKLQAQIDALTLDLKEQQGYAYPIQTKLNEAQEEYDVYFSILSDANAALAAVKFFENEVDSKGEIVYEKDADGNDLLDDAGNPVPKLVEKPASTAYNARKTNLEMAKKNATSTQADIDALAVPTTEELAAKYETLVANAADLQAKSDALKAEIDTLKAAAIPFNEAVTAAEDAITAAEAALETATEAFKTYRRENAIFFMDTVAAKQDQLNALYEKKSTNEQSLSKLTDELEALKAAETPNEGSITSKQKSVDAAQKTLDETIASITTLEEELKTLYAAYDAKVNEHKTEKDAYDKALADLESAKTALEEAKAAEELKALADKEAEKTANDVLLKRSNTALNAFSSKPYTYYDAIAKKLYTAFFKELVAECEENADYSIFMNVGEENADNENGIVAAYNTWYSSMYGE